MKNIMVIKLLKAYLGAFTILRRTGLLILTVFGLLSSSFGQAVGDYGSNGTGNWGAIAWVICQNPGTWVGAIAAGGPPGVANNVWIRAGNNVTANTNPNPCNSIVVQGTLTGSNSNLQVTTYMTNSGTVDYSGATGNISVGTTLNITAGSMTISTGNLTVTGTTNISGGSFTDNNNNGTNTFTGLVTVSNAATWTSTAVTTQANLSFNGGFTHSIGSSGAVGMGAANITILINDGGNFNKSAAGSFTVTGTTNITGGNFIISNNSACIFTGTINLSNAATWTSTLLTTAANLDIRNGIVHNGSGLFNADAATISTNAGQTIQVNSTGNIIFGAANGNVAVNVNMTLQGAGTGNFNYNGTGTMTIANNITVTNQRSVNFTGALTGNNAASTWINDVNSTLNYSNAVNNLMNAGILTASASGNTVNYSAAGNQTIKAANYYNLTIAAGARTITLAAAGTIGISNTFSPGAVTTYTVTGSTVDYNGDANQNIIGNASFATYNNLTVSIPNGATVSRTKTISGSAITVNGNLVIISNDPVSTCTFDPATLGLTVTGTTTINTRSLFSDSNDAGINTFTGAINLLAGNGSFNTNNSTVGNLIIRGGISQLSTANFSTGTVSFNNTQAINGAGTGAINMGDVAIGNAFTVTNNRTVNIANSLTGGNAASTWLNANTSILNYAGAGTPMSTGTFNVNTATNTVNYSGTTQNISGVVYSNLTLSNGGTKTLQGPATVNNILLLTSGILEIGNNNLIIANNANNSIQGAYSSSNMIATNGTGYLIRNALTTLPITYPVGSGGYYSSFSISAINLTTGTISGRAVSGYLSADFIGKYWDVITSIQPKTITATFQYDPAEVNGNTSNYTVWVKPSAGSWQSPPPTGTTSMGANTFTITNNIFSTTTSNYWTAGAPSTYYSYQSGSWNTPSTWTSDPGGTTQVGSTVPGTNDIVVILSGRTVTLPANIAASGLDVTINNGGFLDLSTFQFTSGLLALRGQGTLKSSLNFPNPVTTNSFVLAGGGTTEYNANINMPAQATYNNLTINTGGIVVQLNNVLTLNGNLYVKQGTYQINDNTANRRQLIISGNVTVDNGASITVGTGVTNTITDPTTATTGGVAPFINYYDLHSHRVVINGDFTNNGTVRFTNMPYPVYNSFPPLAVGPTTGFASVYFQGASNNTLTCNGTTDFYNLIIDKGLIDQTYKLTIYSSAYSNFRLFGANVAAGEATGSNANLRKALWIRTGTLDLTGLTVIPSLTEGATAGPPTSDFFIPANAALVIDGNDVIVLSTADDYNEINIAYGLAGGSNAAYGVNTTGGRSALSILGKLQVNNGYLSTRESAGLTYWNFAPGGQFIMNGGTFDTKQIDDAAGGNTGLLTYIQTGGTVIIRGRFQHNLQYSAVSDLVNTNLNTTRLANGINTTDGSFNINSNAASGFSMSGGNMQIYDVCNNVASNAFSVTCPISNISVTGGNVQIIPTTGTGGDANYLINSLAPFWNLSINQVSSASIVQLNTNPLTVLQNLSLQTTTQPGTFDANGLNVTVGGNFSIASAATYKSTGTTTFNGSANQTFTINGTINNGIALGLSNLAINKSSGTLNIAGSSLTVQGTFDLTNGILDDGGNTIYVAGNMTNSGTHISTPGTGKIQLNGTSAQTIGGNGNGVFQNLELNNTTAANPAPVSLIAKITVNGTLNLLSNKIFNLANDPTIASYNLTIGPSGSITATAFSNSCFIQSNGKAGDGGISKVYTSNTPFVFPVGCFSTKRPATYAYTPATISSTTYGSITVIPVGYEQPATTVKGQSLTFFWRVKSNFTGPYSVSHSFVYSSTDINGAIGNYIPSLYNRSNYTWNNGLHTNINTGTYTISDWTTPANSTTFLDADYTAGDNTTGGGAFGTPTKFYSVAGTSGAPAAWNSSSTWSYTSGGAAIGGPSTVGVSYPGPNSIAVIENNHYILLSANASCASLQIASGSTLDIFTYTGSVFSMVQSYPTGNNGLFRLTTTVTGANVPKVFSFLSNSDFSDFNNNHGTTEYYDIDGNTGALYILPANVTTYGNLMVTAKGGDNLVLPNNALTTIQGDLTCGGDNANAWIAVSWNTTEAPYGSGIYNPTIEKTVHVTGNLYVNTGTLIFMPELVPQHLVIDGNVSVAANGYIDVETNAYGTPGGAPQPNTIAIGGNFINNSTATPYVRFLNATYYCNLTFQGPNNATFSGTSPSTTLNNLTINKGTSQATTLTCNIGGTLTTLADNWLTLQNGTFIFARTNPATDFTVSTNTPLTIPSSAGLNINYSNTGNKNILIANNTLNTNDLYLSGKLTIVNGNVYIGPVNTPANNNDIEFSSGGTSAIEVDGGNLIVNGQIRRNPLNAAGILSYTQTGGNVTINGNAAIATNAKLEVLNNGSQFNMSGGTLTIVRGGGTTFGDLYLRPQTSSVTGGTIVFGPGAAIGANQNYQLDANIPLNNITITGFNAANMATVQLMVSPLVVNGNFTLSNVNSIFNAVNGSNNINVTFNGNLINNGGVASYLYGTNLTTFSAMAAAPYFGAQSITGATNFYDVLINPVTSLAMGSNATINRNLTISSGTLLCGATKVTLLGNLINNSSYTTQSNGANQGISLSGTTAQQISGTGSFGRLEINNAAGVKLNNAITLQENLLMTQGIFDINQYLLSLGQLSLIQGAFSATNMIISDGVYSNVGIKKNFSAGVQPLFIFPIGTPGKYTPANLTITANTNAGYIRINNINSKHPTVTDPNNVLNYYWEVESYGILGLSGNLVFNYSQGDVLGPNENTWVGAELVAPNWNFFPPGTGSVNPIANTITINYNNTSSINGEYTAGLVGAFPAIVPTYTSNSDGNWDNINIWTPTSPVGGPNGFNVIINNNVTADVNYCTTYQTKINGDLIIGASTYGHNFGTVSGNGTLTLQSATFPAGRFSSFLDCTTGGTLEYGGIGANYTLVADLYSSVHNLLFSGTGNRILPNNDLVICNQLKINGPTVDNSVYNRKLTIKGTMERYNTGVFKSGGGSSATVTFAGTGAQSLGGATGDFNGTNGLNNFEINNTSGLNLNGSIDVNNNLLLTSGIITTSSTNKLTINNSIITCVTPIGGSSTSFVNGPLIKKINQSDNFIFPVGQGTTLGHQFKLSSVQTGTKFWTVQYNSPNTTSANMTGNLTAVNTQEYWTVKALSGNQAIVNINWDPSSDITPLMTQNGLSDMRVADYNTTTNNWEEIPSTASGNNNNGTVSTTSRVTIPAAGSYDFTIATINTTKPKARLNPSGPVCGTTPAGGIPISFSTPNPALPYTINYTIAGAAQSPISVTSLPYTLPTPSTGTYQLIGFSYSGGTGVVDNGTVVVYANPTIANAGSSQSICGGTNVQLAGNQPGVGTGLWTITGGTGGSFSGAFSPSDPTKYNTYFYGINGNSYTLTWTITNGCSSSSNTTVAFPYLPVQPSSFTVSSATVCQGQSGVVYTVPNDPLETSYTWSYSGSATLNSTNTNSITIDFGPAATGGTLSVYATNGCGNSTSSTMTITVNPIPTAAAGSDINTCTGMAAIAMTGATSGGTNSGNSWTGGGGSGSWTQNANPAFATFTPSAASGSFTATLTVTGSGSCAGTNPTSTRVLAWATNTSISSDPSNSTIFAGQNTSFTVVPGGTGPFTYVWEVSTNSGGSWNSASGGVYSGANTATLSITGALLSMNSYYYHCIVTGTCGNATSNYGILTVNPTATASLGGTTSICVGQNATLTVTLTGTANWSITYTDGVTPHTINNIAASPYTFTVSPSSTTTYTLSAVSDANGAGTISGGGVAITVTPVPATGPLYRKPNQ